MKTVKYYALENGFYCDGELICGCSFDKKQSQYITKHIHENYLKGFRFLYGATPEEIRIQIEKRINLK